MNHRVIVLNDQAQTFKPHDVRARNDPEIDEPTSPSNIENFLLVIHKVIWVKSKATAGLVIRLLLATKIMMKVVPGGW